jgi:23S rRNA (cytidine2498-2'-O)-methyltransferase
MDSILLLCRPGFERDVLLETGLTGTLLPNRGFVIAQFPEAAPPPFHWKQFVFARQWWFCSAPAPLPAHGILDTLLAAGRALKQDCADFVIEYPDTNEGKQQAATEKFLRPLLQEALPREPFYDESSANTLHIFLTDDQRFVVGMADERSAPWAHGFPRLRMPGEAPSRSTLKLAEAFAVFLGEGEREQFLRPGMKAVDLGAAPGGWTWQFLSRGIAVDAVDNGPLKGAVAAHPLVRHLRDDGFKYRPQQPVDWMVCDMVERPPRVVERIADWIERGWARHFIFNLKLPTRKHIEEVRICLKMLEDRLRAADIRYRLQARHLYHDREEITCYLRREGKASVGKGKFKGKTSW